MTDNASETGRDPYPERSRTAEIVQGSVEAVVSGVPFVGGPLAVIFAALMSVPLARRQATWLNELAEAIEDLQDQVEPLKPENLQNNEDFLDAVVTASRAAERTHQREKIDSLRNACINTVLPDAPDTDLRMVFFKLIDEFTGSHLRLLHLLHQPGAWLDAHDIARPQLSMGSRARVVEVGLPELAGRREFYDQLLRDLHVSGLVHIDGLHGMQTGSSLYDSVTSPLGARFIAFTGAPQLDRSSAHI